VTELEDEVELSGPTDRELVQLAFSEARSMLHELQATATRRLRIRIGALELEVERDPAPAQHAAEATRARMHVSDAAGTSATLRPITAPLVGVFYRAGSPGAKPFVEVGDQIAVGDVVGIVEAMKVMNHITSELHGTVVEVLVEDGAAVQFEQPLLLVDTTSASASRENGLRAGPAD
jgi:acetyl-CoA carboxylase biotin carboxyl carrier protein